MKKWVCPICGYVEEGEKAPEFCPICKCPGEKFTEQAEDLTWAAEHVVGVAQGAPEEIIQGLRENFTGECSEVGMYLAMSRQAFREGYPEVGDYYHRAALEEAEHAAKFAELLGEVLTDSTKKNLQMRVDAENGATAGKTALAKKAKELNLDAIHDTVHEMTRPVTAKHSKAFWTVTSPTDYQNKKSCSQFDLTARFFIRHIRISLYDPRYRMVSGPFSRSRMSRSVSGA